MPGPALNPTQGVRKLGGGAETNPRANTSGEMATGAAHGTWLEAIRQGNLWTISTPTAGITVTANMLVSVASANCIVGLYNKSAGKNLHITRAEIVVASAATATAFVWAYNPPTQLAVTPTGVALATNHNLLTTGASPSAVAFNGSIPVSGAAVTTLFRPIVVAAINTGINVEEFDDDLWVPPFGFLGIFGTTVTTSTVVNASMTWEEVDLT